MTEMTIQVPINRRLLWELRQRYDEATIADMARIVHCGRHERRLAGLAGTIIGSFIVVLAVAGMMPGPLVALWPSLVLVSLLAGAAVVRIFMRAVAYGRARMAIQNADSAKF